MLSLTILILITIAMSMSILLKAIETKNSNKICNATLLVIFMPIMILFLVFVFFISQMNFL